MGHVDCLDKFKFQIATRELFFEEHIFRWCFMSPIVTIEKNFDVA